MMTRIVSKLCPLYMYVHTYRRCNNCNGDTNDDGTNEK